MDSIKFLTSTLVLSKQEIKDATDYKVTYFSKPENSDNLRNYIKDFDTLYNAVCTLVGNIKSLEDGDKSICGLHNALTMIEGLEQARDLISVTSDKEATCIHVSAPTDLIPGLDETPEESAGIIINYLKMMENEKENWGRDSPEGHTATVRTINELKEKIKLSRYIMDNHQDDIKLKDGRGTCPFCYNKNEFAVSLFKDIFYCYSCNEGGDIYSFISKMHDLSFIESFDYLKEKERNEEI